MTPAELREGLQERIDRIQALIDAKAAERQALNDQLNSLTSHLNHLGQRQYTLKAALTELEGACEELE